MKKWLISVGIVSLLVFCTWHRNALADPAHTTLQTTSALTVSIASVIDENYRSIGLWNEVPHFNVVIRNASDKPQKIWAENCSAGNGSLTLEIVAIDGKTLAQPIVVERRARVWYANDIHGVTLEPGDVAVREIHLYQYRPGERSSATFHRGNPDDYTGFPILEANGNSRLFRMRAIFKIDNDAWARREGIWTGRAVSDTRDYRIWGIYP